MRWRHRVQGTGEDCPIEVTANFRAWSPFVRPPLLPAQYVTDAVVETFIPEGLGGIPDSIYRMAHPNDAGQCAPAVAKALCIDLPAQRVVRRAVVSRTVTTSRRTSTCLTPCVHEDGQHRKNNRESNRQEHV